VAGDIEREVKEGDEEGTSATASKVRGSPRLKPGLKNISGTDESGGSNFGGSGVRRVSSSFNGGVVKNSSDCVVEPVDPSSIWR